MNLVELFCQVDDFCQAFEGSWIRHQLTTGHRRRRRAGQLCLSEIMTLLIWFHQSHYRDFKAFYQHHVCKHLRGAFPGLVSYGRFVELMPSTLIPLCSYLRQCQGACTGISFIDSTPLAVCNPIGYISIGFSLAWHNGAKARRAGFSGSNCTWSSMTGDNCSTWR